MHSCQYGGSVAAVGRVHQLGFPIEAVFDHPNHCARVAPAGDGEPFDQQDGTHEHDAVLWTVRALGGEIHAVGGARRAMHVARSDGDLRATGIDLGLFRIAR